MAYCTIQDLKRVLPESDLIDLTDDSGGTALDTAVAEDAIDSAAREIDAYLGVRYRLPLSTVPDLLTRICADLTVHLLMARVKSEIPETWRNRRKDAVALLDKIVDGKITLGVEPPPEPPQSYDGGVKTKSRAKDASATKLRYY